MGQEREVAQRYFQALEDGDVDRAVDLLSSDVDFASPGGRMTGREQVAPFLQSFYRAFPDARFAIDNVIESGREVVVEGNYTGTHTGPLATPDGQEILPTGRSVVLPYVTLLNVEDGLVRSHRAYWDQMTFMSQLGLVAPPA